MLTLGITDGHTATACLLKEGQLLGMVSEERLNRKKGWGGFPAESIKWLFSHAGVKGSDVDAVAISSLVQPVWNLGAADASPLRTSVRVASRVVPASVMGSDLLVKNYVRHFSGKRNTGELKQHLGEMGVNSAKLQVVEHHSTHAATAYYPAPFYTPEKQMLVITIDGSGDGLSATVSMGNGGRLQRLHTIASYHSIGDFYMRVTQFMGMKPLEHEYKVMGLAPYAPAEWAQKAYDAIKDFYGPTADGLSFENRSGRWGSDMLPLLEDRLRGHRFDSIAAAAQRIVEEVVTGFVRSWIRKTGIHSLGCAGGVFMNVKANMLISQMPEVEEVFFMPSGGDESTCLGAALDVYVRAKLESNEKPDIRPLGGLYLGPEFGNDAALSALEEQSDKVSWTRPASMPELAAELLAKNQILARMCGRMEWGARSLGNRTIIANPSDLRNVRNINRAIKMRDFWMPFCPTILHERRHDYTQNPKDITARYMINAFESTRRAFDELVCGLHPFDLTCRPQFLTEEENPGFYAIIKAFERRTKIGGVLNTSFNLHGEPIVYRPADAISTLLRSDIDYLILSDYIVWRKDKPAPDTLS